jgi:hypothetical protein
MQSCLVPSFYPLYELDDVVEVEAFEGEWIASSFYWEISPAEKSSYRLIYRECDDPVNFPNQYSVCSMAEFRMNLIELDGQYYADFYPVNYMNTENQLLNNHLKAFHTFARMSIDNVGQLKIEFLNREWLEDLLKKNPNAIDFVNADNEIQAFIKKYANEKRAFYDPLELERRIDLLKSMPVKINPANE